MRHYTKFRCDRSNGDFSTFSKWRPSAILESSYAYLDHPRRVFCGLITVQNLVGIDVAVSIIGNF